MRRLVVMVIGLGAALLAAVLFGVGAVVQAVAARRGGLVSRLMALVVADLRRSAGRCTWSPSRCVPLYVAQVGIAASLAVTALLAATGGRRAAGARGTGSRSALMVGGLALLALAAGPVGDPPVRCDGITVVLYVALVVLLRASG